MEEISSIHRFRAFQRPYQETVTCYEITEVTPLTIAVEWPIMVAALIGVVGALSGVILGSGITELFRRSSRIEHYASQIFDKRVQIHEELFRKVMEGKSIAEDVMDAKGSTAEERHATISVVIMDIAEYCDKNAFYLSPELTVHCIGALMGAEEVQELNGSKQQRAAERVRDDARRAMEMIRAEAGIERINKLFRNITRAKLSSPLIDLYRQSAKRRGELR